MINKKISVIIPAYNAEMTIKQTLNSVFNQTYGNLEVIIVNDGSTDGTLDILEKQAARIKIISTSNKGVSHARNTGLKNASGDYIQFLDADDLLIPDKIEIQLTALEAEDADIAYGNWQKFIELDGKITLKEITNREISYPIEVDLFTDFWCPPAALLYSKAITEKIGPWKEWLPIIQDARYMLDAAMQKGKFIYCPVLVAQYRTGQENSLSNKNSLNFVKDCYNNAKDVWSFWQHDNEDIQSKKAAIIQSIRYCIYEFSILDRSLFHEAINFMLQINPQYIPAQSGALQIFSRIFGYRNAEKIAAMKRKLWH